MEPHGIERIINNLFKTKHRFIFILFSIYELIFLTGKKVAIGVRNAIEKFKSKNK